MAQKIKNMFSGSQEPSSQTPQNQPAAQSAQNQVQPPSNTQNDGGSGSEKASDREIKSSDDGIITKLKKYVNDHQKISLGAACVAASGIIYYFQNRRDPVFRQKTTWEHFSHFVEDYFYPLMAGGIACAIGAWYYLKVLKPSEESFIQRSAEVVGLSSNPKRETGWGTILIRFILVLLIVAGILYCTGYLDPLFGGSNKSEDFDELANMEAGYGSRMPTVSRSIMVTSVNPASVAAAVASRSIMVRSQANRA